MAVQPSIPVNVDTKLSLTTAEQAHDLDKAFDDLWGPLSDKPSEAKAAEPEPKPKETETSQELSESKLEATEELPLGGEPEKAPEAPQTAAAKEPEPKKEEPHPDDEPDEELDTYRLHPNSTPEVVDQFRTVRGMAKRFKRELSEAKTKAQNQESELTTLRTTQRPVNDPTVQAELEQLRDFRQKHQIYDDAGFQAQFEQPIYSQFDEIINDVKAMAPDKEAAGQWEGEIRKLGPDRIGKQYWNEGVIQQVADPIDRDRMVRKVTKLLELQQHRNNFAAELAEQPDRYTQYQSQQAAAYWQDFSVQAEDEANKISKTLGDWAAPKDPNLAKSPVERQAIELHNKTYTGYLEGFKNLLTDAATGGPRGITRVAVQAVQGMKYKADLDQATGELKRIKAELQKAREELSKIAGVRSRVAQSTGGQSNGAKPTTEVGKASKSLDAAFKDFFGQQ